MSIKRPFYKQGKNERKPGYWHVTPAEVLNTSITESNSWREEAADQFCVFKTVSETRGTRDINKKSKKKIKKLITRQFPNNYSSPDTQSRGIISIALPNQKQQNAVIFQKESTNSYIANIEHNESEIILSKYPNKLPENTKPKGKLFGFIREGNKLVPITEKPEMNR